MKKHKYAWLIALVAVLAALFALGATGVFSLRYPDKTVRVSRLAYRADIHDADDRILVLDDVAYTPDGYTATVSGELVWQTNDGRSTVDVPAQRVSFKPKADDLWYCRLTVGDEHVVLYAYRQKLASMNGETAYGGINYLQFEGTEYLFWREEP